VEACKVPERRITIIPNGVDVDFFRPPFTAPPQDKTVILCVARLVPDKDHETLISAFDLIARQHQDVELWMAGNGERLAALKQLAARSVAHGRIRFLRGQPDVRPLLHQCTLFALSSCREAMPNAVLEAMACGLPVIATATGGLPELVEHGRTGFLVPKQNAPALARAMEKLLMDEKARAAFGKRARERVEQCYSVSAMVRSHTDLFCSLLDGRDRGIGHGRRRMGSPWRIK